MMVMFKGRKVKKARTEIKNAKVQDHNGQKTKDEREKAQGKLYISLNSFQIVLVSLCKLINFGNLHNLVFFVAETVQLCLSMTNHIRICGNLDGLFISYTPQCTCICTFNL